MPLISVARTLAALLSLLVLAGAAWLLWTWYDGVVLRDAAGALYREREPWRLWTGLGLLAWSLLGRLALLPMLAGNPLQRVDRRVCAKGAAGGFRG